MMAVGVASPRAQGQAMTSTATMRIMAGTNSPPTHQQTKVTEGDGNDGRHKNGRHPVRQGLDGGLAALGLLHHPDDPGQGRVPAHFGGFELEKPWPVDGAAHH